MIIINIIHKQKYFHRVKLLNLSTIFQYMIMVSFKWSVCRAESRGYSDGPFFDVSNLLGLRFLETITVGVSSFQSFEFLTHWNLKI